MAIELTVIITILGIIISYQAYQLNKDKNKYERKAELKQETKEEARQDATIQTQLDYISRGVDDIRIDLKANEKQIVQLGERVTRVEESSKQAHKRIDKIEGGDKLG